MTLKLKSFPGPIVGLQIRRTDKINTEASFHDLDEYMRWVEDWFQIEEYRTQSSIKRRIYIATDDPEIFDEAMMKFVVHFLCNRSLSLYSFVTINCCLIKNVK